MLYFEIENVFKFYNLKAWSLVIALLFIILCPSSFAIILMGKRKLVALLN